MKAKENNFRVILLYLFVLCISFSLIAKIVKIQQFDQLINTSSQPRFFDVDAPRGNILSDDGSLLAISMPLYNIYLDLGVVDNVLFEDNVVELSEGLAVLFDTIATDYENFLRGAKQLKNNRYIKFKTGVDHNQLVALKKLPILKLDQNKGGLIAEQRPNRKAPFDLLAQRTIGVFRDYNPVGIEVAYDPFLSGTSGVHLKRKIAPGIWIPQKSDQNKMPKPGHDVVTTINIDMQDVAEEALKRTLITENADWGCVVLMEVKTGEIKVIANLEKDSLQLKERYNYAIAEHIAPGSTFKLASLIAGLEDQKFEITDSVDLELGEIKYYDRVMKDSPHKLRNVTIEQAFIMSSNVGISKIINNNYKNNPSAFTDRIYKMGLSTPLKIELPYPSSLKMPIPNKRGWSGVTLPWMSTGYEMALTPLHMLTFYNAIANKGKMMRPIFTTSILDKGQAVIQTPYHVINPAICSRSTIDKVMPLLIGVVNEGTAGGIKSNIYQIAGKTGTTVLNYAGRKEGEKKEYQASFVGFFPADNPKYSCIVVINNPKNGQVYGGKVAAPIFKELADKVFAFDIDIHHPMITSHMIKDLPDVKQGSANQAIQALNILGYENSNIDESYIIPKYSATEIKFLQSNIEKDLQNGKMPDLHGITLQDAICLLETYGVSVKSFGSGSVIGAFDESGKEIKKGQILKKGTLINLKLS